VLELFQPSCSADFFFSFRAATGAGKEESLFLDQLIVEGISVALVIFGPISQGFLNIRDSALSTFDGRSTSIVRVEIFLLLA
jgi:hypothetical protein